MKSKAIHFSKPIVSPITISDLYPTFLSIGNLNSNRPNKPNPLAITKIDYPLLSKLITKNSWSSTLKQTDFNKTTLCFTNT